ncbi:MAG: FKBP-type peptidyl-prolyl cis-trans isomerase [Prevotella sp.]|nr:FKBP-type peptidyl-prolyl cis-trans isomerase [Prevotella sp.]
MKKLSFLAVTAIAAATLVSCGSSTPKANLKSDVDSLTYAIGMAQSEGLVEYLVRQGVDTTYMKEFIKGLNEGASAGDDKKKAAYYAGIMIGQQVGNQMYEGINRQIYGEDSTQSISKKNLMAGFISGITGKKALMQKEEAQMYAQMKMEAIRAKVLEEKYGENKKAGEDFLAANAKKEGVKTIEGSNVQYKVIKEGNGELPKDTSLVTVHYEGKLIDGTVFDSSYERKEPTKFRANQVIKGWTEALVHMPAGSVWEVYIPQDKAYGAQETSKIKPFSTLIFKIELKEVNK